MPLRFLAAVLALVVGTAAGAQQTAPARPATTARAAAAPTLSDVLPVDSKVSIGTLPNGIRYYIRQNEKPENRAELRLVVNTGSINEDEDQLGLAHFLEHTAFNGTRNFKKNELVSYLQSIGVRFGPDLNAQTGFNETIYILPGPSDSMHLVARGFQILEDWAHGQIFDSVEVVNERGVVLEEWRGRKGAQDRMLQEWLPIALKGSRYAERLPIGTEAGIMGATPSRLRRFYTDWYRPEQMAVIAVGDFDKAAIEALIRKHFSGIKASGPARKPAEAVIPPNKAPLVAIASDKEATSSVVSLMFKLPPTQTKTVGDYRRDLAERLYLGMLNARLSEIAQKPDAPFLGASSSKGNFFAKGTDVFSLDAGVKDNEIARGLEALLVETKRVEQHGFLPTELEREKRDILRAYETSYAEREKTNSGAFVQEYIQHFTTGDGIPGIEYEYALVQKLLPTITLAEINGLSRQWITDENRVIIALSPEKEGVKVPSEGELLAVFDKAAQAQVAAYAESLSDAPLLGSVPPAGRVVATKTMPEVGVTEWTLSNGARVLLKPTDFKADEVLFNAYSDGGTSLASNADFMSAAQAAQVISLSGIGEFNRVDLGKKLSGKAVNLTPMVSNVSEGLSGRASPKDIQTLFELIHLQFTAPRLDTAAYQAFQAQAAQFIANRGSNPNQVFSDTIQTTMSQHHFRARPLTAATFAEIDPAKAVAFYRDRFADASDFTFLFVGSFNADSLKPLVERYIASLPAKNRKESWKDVGLESPKGVIEKTVRKGVEPKASTLIVFTGPFAYTPQNRFDLAALRELFLIKATETLREQLGGTYSASVNAGSSRVPTQEYSIQVSYGSSPENVDTLEKTVFALIETLKKDGPSQADVDKVKEQLTRTREVQMKQNGYWVGNIAARDQAKEDLAGLLAPYDAMIAALTPAQIQKAARQYFDTKNYAKFVLLPEKAAPTP